MARAFALLQDRQGTLTKIGRKEAYRLVESGQFSVIRERPLTIREVDAGSFGEEQRHLAGRKVPGATKGRFCGKNSQAQGVRVRPPRGVYDREGLATDRYLDDRRWEEQEARREAAEEIERKRRRAARRKRRTGRKRKRRETAPRGAQVGDAAESREGGSLGASAGPDGSRDGRPRGHGHGPEGGKGDKV